MGDTFLVLVGFPAALLVAVLFLPRGLAWKHIGQFRWLVERIAAFQFFVASGAAIGRGAGWLPNVHTVLLSLSEAPIAATVYYDGVASLMLTLVSFIGWVICKYSIRYLDGELAQDRFFRWTAFTIGSVSLMVISGNLVMFITTWIMTSIGLHQLLMHYGHRPAARRAAWTKFVISRMGDAALIAATVIIYNEFNTLDFSELFIAVGNVTRATPAMQAASFMLIAGAITKSAQFPFHTWLPQTLETPTPVSALMHAGIVNAGGYLIIRTSPLVSLAPWALTTVAIIGGFTACFAAVVMMTQTSIKKSLAYSTIAQMGFMMLQCGLGAYSAAMLHILAHSLYKAYAFLSSGNLNVQPTATFGTTSTLSLNLYGRLAGFAAMIIAFLWLSFWVVGVDPLAKPGGLLLGSLLCLALTQWVGQVLSTGNNLLLFRSFLIAGALCFVYASSFFVVDATIKSGLPVSSTPSPGWLVATFVLTGFAGMFVIQTMLTLGSENKTLNHWRIHVSNGFYLESMVRRVFERLIHI